MTGSEQIDDPLHPIAKKYHHGKGVNMELEMKDGAHPNSNKEYGLVETEEPGYDRPDRGA